MSETTESAYILGRQASIRGERLGINPFNLGSSEAEYWNDGFNAEEEHTRLLSISFAAKKETEEKMEMQEEQIETLKAKLLSSESNRDSYYYKLDSVSRQRDVYDLFIRRLRDNPPRWAKQYKERVEVFCESIGI